MAIDDLTDVSNTAQLFIKEVTAKFEMTEQLVSMNRFCGTTTGKNIIKVVKKRLVYYNLKQNLQRCVTTDGGKNVCGAELLVGQIYKVCENVMCLRSMV